MHQALLKQITDNSKTGRDFVVDNIGPINALVVFTTIVLVPLLDILRPKLPGLGPVVALFALMAVLTLIGAKLTGRPARLVFPSTVLTVAAISAGVFCAGAYASSFHSQQGGVIASYSATVRGWQDAWLVAVKEDTTEIRVRTAVIEQKVDQQSFMLSQVLASMRPQYERVLVEEVKGYTNLPKNQQDALVYFTSKVGTNGLKRYKKLTAAVAQYSQEPSEKARQTIEDSTKYVVQVNGREIEDTKTRLLVLAMFFEPNTFDYLVGNGPAPQVSRLLAMFNVNPIEIVGKRIPDPLGDFISAQQNQGVQVVERVVIPRDVEVVDNFRKDVVRSKVKALGGL